MQLKDCCPIYNNSKSAYWVSETMEIKNPYLGKAMPTCAIMQEEMKYPCAILKKYYWVNAYYLLCFN